jgi:magnesium transporter
VGARADFNAPSGTKRAEAAESRMIDVYTYKSGEGCRHTRSAEDLPKLLEDPDRVTWVDFEAPDEDETVLLESIFHFHVLAIEDCIHSRSLPKIDVFEQYIFIVVHGIRLERGERDFANTPLNLILGSNYLVSFHHEPVRSIRSTKALLAKSESDISRGPDYLLHTILDFLVDNYQPILDEMDVIVDSIEERIVTDPKEEVLSEILSFKRTLQKMRRIAAMQKEILNRLSREEFNVIEPKLQIYFRDVYDHLVRVTDLSESYKEILASAVEAYLSIVSNRLNEVVKVLTIFSTIILPMTLIASIFGMNLEFPFHPGQVAFWLTIASMGVVAVVLYFYFRRRRWL